MPFCHNIIFKGNLSKGRNKKGGKENVIQQAAPGEI